MAQVRQRLQLKGVVQGVGLRPLLYQLAQQYHLSGWVKNTALNVTLEWQGTKSNIAGAIHHLTTQLETLGNLNVTQQSCEIHSSHQFVILPSEGQANVSAIMSPDRATCSHCLTELFESTHQLYQYPFISCASCGPRYTITRQLPYDRLDTTMKPFPLCQACDAQYKNPADRRFHAQTISCWQCGPQCWITDKTGKILARQADSISALIQALKAGNIAAVKGIGGFHLIALASHDEAVKRLRLQKGRPDKPFAMMVKDLSMARGLSEVSDEEAAMLSSPIAPIVLLKQAVTKVYSISALVAPERKRYGIMLAYAPIHHLILSVLNEPLIATSANLKGDPICFENTWMLNSLEALADIAWFHNRDIVHPLDDSIVQFIAGTSHWLRRARGGIPLSLSAPSAKETRIALGGQLKNTVAIHQGKEICVSAYLGDLDTMSSLSRFQHMAMSFLDKHPAASLICDKHPDYASTQWASSKTQTPVQIQHHQAHIAAVMLENKLAHPLLGLAWDGLGWGNHEQMWGGEAFWVTEEGFQRVISLWPMPLLGGEKAIVEPRRMALALCLELIAAGYIETLPQHVSSAFTPEALSILQQLYQSDLPKMMCTSMGRLFDGIAFLLGGPAKMSFEGQAALYLEENVLNPVLSSDYPVQFEMAANQKYLDWRPMLVKVLLAIEKGLPIEVISAQFHGWCCQAMLAMAKQFITQKIVLSGGVFQNRILLEQGKALLQLKGYQVYHAKQLPSNDGALAVGQLYAHLLKKRQEICA